jgi:pimeloyl-ACP methyl ester carboxylesterase
MRRGDIQAIGEAAGEALGYGGRFVQEMHENIAGRPFGALGAAAAPVRAVHDGVSRAVYAGVRGALSGAGRAGAGLFARGARDDGPPAGASGLGSIALGTLNGLYGNHLTDRGNGLALRMAVRRHAEDVPLERARVAAAYPDAGPRLAVFVHGLFGDDDNWRVFPLRGRHPGRRTYGERLQDDLGLTPVHVRYNTGLHISANGRELARLLDDLLAAWPCEVQDVVLIGHSMGGLVVRSACHYGEADGRAWTAAVRHVVCLGSPHLGADLEKGANVLAWAAARLPETRAFAGFLNARSVGIKDLRYGACTDEDWCDCDPDEFLRDRCREVPFLPDAHYCFIGATLSDGPLGHLVGDLLVRIPSASGRGNGTGRRIPFEVDNGRELAGLNHFDLLNHPAVYEQLRAWLARAPAEAAQR